MSQRPGYLIRRLHQIHVALFQDACGEFEVTPLNFSGPVRLLSTLDGAVQNQQAGDDPRVGSAVSGPALETVATEQKKELAGLPAKFGFATVAEFVAAVRAASGKRRGRKPGAAKAIAKKARRPRAVITDETRSTVKKLVADGKTGAEIAKAVGISLPSVQNIKKALGLVAKRKK